MLKYQCRGCGQNVVVVERLTGVEHTCPRCGAVNRPKEPAEPARDDHAVMADVLAREQAAQRRRQEQEAQELARRDAALAQDLDKRRQEEARIARFGTTGRGDRRRSGLPWVFGAIVVGLLGWAGLVSVFSGGAAVERPGEQIAPGLDIEPKLARRVDQWVRSIAGRLSYAGKPIYPYRVHFDSVEREGESVLLLRGVVQLADRELTAQELAARTATHDVKADPKDKLTRREELREGIGLLREAYDPDRINSTAGQPSEKPALPKKSAESSAAESLRKIGFEAGAEPASAATGLDLTRPFICVVRTDESLKAYPGGAAMEYFVWDEQLTDGTLTALRPAEQQGIEAQLVRLFDAISKGNLQQMDVIRTYDGRSRDSLFPSSYQPASWNIARCDRSRSGTVRAFVRVTDKSPGLSGTWIMTLLNLESDRQYRVADVWRPEP